MNLEDVGAVIFHIRECRSRLIKLREQAEKSGKSVSTKRIDRIDKKLKDALELFQGM